MLGSGCVTSSPFCADADVLDVRCLVVGVGGGGPFTRAGMPYLCHALWFLFAPVNRNHGDLSSERAQQPRWESGDVALEVLRERW